MPNPDVIPGRCGVKRMLWDPFGIMYCSRRMGHHGRHRARVKYVGRRSARKYHSWPYAETPKACQFKPGSRDLPTEA